MSPRKGTSCECSNRPRTAASETRPPSHSASKNCPCKEEYSEESVRDDVVKKHKSEDDCSCNDSDQESCNSGREPQTTLLIIDEFFVDVFAETPKFRMRTDTVVMEEDLDGVVTKYYSKKKGGKDEVMPENKSCPSYPSIPQFGWRKSEVEIFVPAEWDPSVIFERVDNIRKKAEEFHRMKEEFVEQNDLLAVTDDNTGSSEPRQMCLNMNDTQCHLNIDPKCKFLVDQPKGPPQDPNGPLALQICEKKDVDCNVNSFQVNFLTPNLENDEPEIARQKVLKHLGKNSKCTQCEEKEFVVEKPKGKADKGKKGKKGKGKKKK